MFHLAAEVGGIGANRANPGRYWFANLAMGANVLEQARICTRRRSSSSSAPSAPTRSSHPVPFSEDELWDGYPEETNAPYGVAKKAILVGAQAYREQYGLDAIFLLPTNLYGPRDNFDLETSHVIPALIRKMVEAEDEVVLWGDGSPTREFLYVDDCVDGLVLAAERYDGAGSGQPRRGTRDLDPRARGAHRRRDRLRGRDRVGHVEAERPAAAKRRRLRAPASSSGSRRRHRCARGSSAPSRGTARRSRVSARRRALAAARWGGRTVDRLLERPRAVLGALIAAQIAATLALALSVAHNGWVWFQGGDQIWMTTTGWLLGQRELPPTEIGYLWPAVQAPVTWATGPTYVQALPPLVLVQVLVLGPLALLCVYGIASRIGGRLLGYWASLLWVVAPFAAIPLFVDRYHERWSEQFLPQALGLTAMADFPSMVLVLAAVLFVVRSLSPGRVTDAVLAGVLIGAAAALKPPNLLVAGWSRARVRRRASMARGARVRRGHRARAPRPPALEGARAR